MLVKDLIEELQKFDTLAVVKINSEIRSYYYTNDGIRDERDSVNKLIINIQEISSTGLFEVTIE